MKKMAYTNKIDDAIISHENNMLAVYLEKIRKYMPAFEKKGYFLKVGLLWRYFSENTVLYQRGSFKKGYECYVYCEVQKDGKMVCVESIDDEPGYEALSWAWMISYINMKMFRLNVELFEDIDDEVDEDLNDFLSQLQHANKIYFWEDILP